MLKILNLPVEPIQVLLAALALKLQLFLLFFTMQLHFLCELLDFKLLLLGDLHQVFTILQGSVEVLDLAA